jgi:Beta-lactamase
MVHGCSPSWLGAACIAMSEPVISVPDFESILADIQAQRARKRSPLVLGAVLAGGFLAAAIGIVLAIPLPEVGIPLLLVGLRLLARIIEIVTGLTYERAVASLLFEPLGLEHSFYLASDVLSRRFAVGHNPGEDGALAVARLRKRWRGDNPGGGLESSAADLLRWARFHLGDGRTESGEEVLSTEVLHRMKEPTVELRGSSLGDAFGIAWFLRDVDGVRTVGHGGSTNGQFSELLTVPERDFAVVSLSNAGPDGIPFNQAVVRWALEHYLGVLDQDSEPIPHDDAWAREVAGDYDMESMWITVAGDGTELTLAVGIKPEIRAAAETDLPPDYAPAAIGRLPGDGDEYIITEGGMKGQRGFFTRDEHGVVVGVDLAGRAAMRVA